MLIPVLGNIIVALGDLHWARLKRRVYREGQEEAAKILNLRVDQLPQDPGALDQLLANKAAEKFFQETTALVVTQLDTVHTGLNKSIEKFRALIDNPEEPLEQRDLFHTITSYSNAPQQVKIAFFWTQIKVWAAVQDVRSLIHSTTEDEPGRIKLQDISHLFNELSQLRRDSYRNHIQTLSTEELLKEAKQYYLESFPEEERKAAAEQIEQITLEAILPRLKERVSTKGATNLDVLEMQELLDFLHNSI